MDDLEIGRFIQVPLTMEAFQFTGGAKNAKAIINRLLVKGGEATWRPAWLSFDRGHVIENPETLELERHSFITAGDWIILKPNLLKIGGVEIKILDDTRFKDRYILADQIETHETHTENTLERVYGILSKVTGDEVYSRYLITALQNEGILFRERI